METCNVDFKENIMKKVQTIKLKDTAELNHKVNINFALEKKNNFLKIG